NKYGEIKTKTELETLQKTAANSSEYLVTQGTVYRKFSYDMLSDPIQSTPAALTLKAASPDDVAALSLAGGSNGLDLSAKTRTDLRDLMQISVDGSDFVSIGLEHLAGKEGTDQLSGQELAVELTNVIQERFGDGKKFNVSAYYASGAAIGTATLDITRDYGEANESYLAVPIGNIIAAAIQQSDIVPTGDAATPMINPEELALAMNKYFAGDYAAATPALAAPTGSGGRAFSDISVEYDFARQALRITQTGDDTLHLSTDSALAGELFGAVNLDLATPGDAAQRSAALATINALASADGDKAIVLTDTMVPAGDLIAEQRNQRYGIEVNFLDGSFVISSGTTGDGSSIAIRNVLTVDANGNAATANATGEQLFGLSVEAGTPESENTVSVAEALSAVANRPAVRGQASTPAMVMGNQMGIDPSKPFEVTEDNRSLTVIVDNISSQILLATGQYSVGDFTTELENKINLMADKLGRQVSGVRVEFDAVTSSLKFTGSTATDDSFLQVAGSADFGLEDVEPAFGTTSTYIRLSPDTQGTTPLYVYQDRSGEWLETTDKGTFDENDIPNWSPIFLDRGELTFDTSGTLVSPVAESVLKSATIIGNDINVAYAGSTQYNSPFAVLNQSQNGAPEGDLVGVNIGEDGLVVASYSNGSQKSLGKIILANFATPKGLRQVGNSGFTATSQSGEAKLGEPGAAGFGTIRAGATERSNVDLTAELVALITAQRNFQANAKAIETSSTLTQTIIQMRG
ncbi:MAG: flagellar hook-basal body complex protein, partial [Proteobacteria bacterium]|nr:flagellar hook-basal body complex protein [Pseudomonadota bacterium]